MKHKAVALILALFTLMFITLLVVAFLDMATIDQQITTNALNGLKAEYLADAGVETAVYNLRLNASYAGTGAAVIYPVSGNSYNVSVSGGIINSTGTAGVFSRRVVAGYTQAGSTVTLNNWTIIDG